MCGARLGWGGLLKRGRLGVDMDGVEAYQIVEGGWGRVDGWMDRRDVKSEKGEANVCGGWRSLMHVGV